MLETKLGNIAAHQSTCVRIFFTRENFYFRWHHRKQFIKSVSILSLFLSILAPVHDNDKMTTDSSRTKKQREEQHKNCSLEWMKWKKRKEIKKHHDDGNIKYAMNFTSLFCSLFFFGAYKTLVVLLQIFLSAGYATIVR